MTDTLTASAENRIRAAMRQLLGGPVPDGLKCDVKSLCQLSGVPRATFYRTYPHLRAEFEQQRGIGRAAGQQPDPRLAQIDRLKAEVTALRARLAARQAEIDDLKAFRTQALSRLAAQHDELTTLRRHTGPVVAQNQAAPTATDPSTTAAPAAPPAPGSSRQGRRAEPCPTCGNEPADASSLWSQRQDLNISWLEVDPTRPGEIIEVRHCAKCQPRQHVSSADCALCDNGPILVGDLADELTKLHQVPEPVRRWLLDHGWHDHPRHGLICPDHALVM
jgi:hypothetical protein